MKQLNMEKAVKEARAALDSAMMEVKGNTNETAADKEYAARLLELDNEQAANDADYKSRLAAIPTLDSLATVKSTFVPAPDDAHVNSAAPVADVVASFGRSLDMSSLKAKFARFHNATITDNLTAFAGASAIENVALPVVRISAIARILLDPEAKAVIGKTKMPNSDKTYSATKSPLTRFLMDELELSKTQANDYLKTAHECTCPNGELMEIFKGFSFTQLTLLARCSYPCGAAGDISPNFSVSDFKAALAKWENDRAQAEKAATNGQPDESKPDATNGKQDATNGKPAATNGQPDESKAESKPDASAAATLITYLYGRLPYDNSCNFNPMVTVTAPDGTAIPDNEQTPEVIHAANVASAIDVVTSKLVNNKDLVFRVPSKTAKVLLASIPDSMAGYKVHALLCAFRGGISNGQIWAVVTVETTGTTEADESIAKAAKRIKDETAILTQWLTGATTIPGINPATETENALDVFAKAKGFIDNVPRMTAVKALIFLVNPDASNETAE